MSFSKPSTPIFSIDIPEVRNITSKFFYNFYIPDESVNEFSGVPEFYKIKSPEQITTTIAQSANFTTNVPRYVSLSWEPVNTSNLSSNFDFSQFLQKIASEDDFTSSKFINYVFDDIDDLENAYKDINNDGILDLGTSQATQIDNYVSSLLSKFSITPNDPDFDNKKNQILEAVKAIENIADNPSRTLGISFIDENGNPLTETSGFEQAISSEDSYLRMQLNALVLPDLFSNVSLPKNTVNDLNNFYKNSVNNRQLNVDDINIQPIRIGIDVANPASFVTRYSVIGYIIERYEQYNDGLTYKKNKVFYIKNPSINYLTDVLVKYGTVYHYAIKTIALVKTQAYCDDDQRVKTVDYLISSKPKFTKINCIENVPPPNPTNLNFVWNYKNSKLNITWQHPSNPQRDITQYQIFRRKSIDEPFELLAQRCFDFSSKKYVTGELIDGNRNQMTPEEKTYVQYENRPSFIFLDEEFMIDAEFLTTSKYIYAVAAVDAHGLISNYSAQFEVSFDFMKNKLVSKLISRSGAPRQYPNLNLNTDLFKDVIATSGEASMNLKIYFMPEYYNIAYRNKIERTLWSKQDNSYYRLQFINTQNQKMDSLKITIDDPYNLTQNKFFLLKQKYKKNKS